MFHLGVSRFLKGTDTERLRCTTKTTDQYKSAERSMRIFAILRTRILREVNEFIDKFTTKSYGT